MYCSSTVLVRDRYLETSNRIGDTDCTTPGLAVAEELQANPTANGPGWMLAAGLLQILLKHGAHESPGSEWATL